MKREELTCLIHLAKLYPHRMKYENDVLKCYNRALGLCDEIDLKTGMISIYNGLAYYYSSFDYEKAYSYTEKGLQIALELNDEDINLANKEENFYPVGKAIKTDKERELIAQYKWFGQLEEEWGKFGSAIYYYRKGMEIIRNYEKSDRYFLFMEHNFYEEFSERLMIIKSLRSESVKLSACKALGYPPYDVKDEDINIARDILSFSGINPFL